jgi:hypothetical protein
MNTDSHSVTVPISDYNEMKSALETAKTLKESVAAHFLALSKSGVEINLSSLRIGSQPKRAHLSHASGGTLVNFEY